MTPEWEDYADNVRRIAVPGGWLFRTCAWVELPTGPDEPNNGFWNWSDPVFVPIASDLLEHGQSPGGDQAENAPRPQMALGARAVRKLLDMSPSSDRIANALAESVKLQSHYAGLLNTYDGGRRQVFSTVDEWLARLDEVASRSGGRT